MTNKKPEPGSASSQPHPRSPRKVVILAAGSLLAAAGIAGCLVIAARAGTKTTDPFTPSIRSAVSIPLYFPGKLPKGFHIEASSVSQPQSGTVVFKAVGPHGAAIYLSESPLPKKTDYDLKSFYGSFKDISYFPTPLGQATAGNVGDGSTRIVSLVVGGKTWIIADTRSGLSAQDLRTVVQSLRISQ